MCDTNDFAIGAVLGTREDGKPYVIYYASKTLNEAQRNYTTTEDILHKNDKSHGFYYKFALIFLIFQRRIYFV